MSEPKEIPEEILELAAEAVYSTWLVSSLASARDVAREALEAARVPEMLAARERIGLVLFQNGYDAGYTTDGAIEAIEAMAARIAAYEEATQEAEAILGGEYGDHFGAFMDIVSKTREVSE